MVLERQLLSVDDVWRLSHQPEHANKSFCLIKGELHYDMPPGGEHGHLAFEIAYHLRRFLDERDLGIGTVETGYYPAGDRHTLLSPDVAFISKSRAPSPFPKRFVPVMPDLAVEILSPNDSWQEARRKAETYLLKGTKLLWIVLPEVQGIEVCRASDDGGMSLEFVGREGSVSGEAVLPGFRLEIEPLFASA